MIEELQEEIKNLKIDILLKEQELNELIEEIQELEEN